MLKEEQSYMIGTIFSVIILFFLIEIHNMYLYLFFVGLSVFFLVKRFSRQKGKTLMIFLCLATVLFIDQYFIDILTIYYK